MAATVADLRARLGVDDAGFNRSMSSADRRFRNLGDSSKKNFGIMRHAGRAAFLGIGAAGAGLALGLKKSIDAASNLGESQNAVNVVFGKGAKIVHAYGKTAATAAGLSERAFNEAVTPIGAALRNVGLGADEAANKAIALSQRAADMASVFNVDVSEALTAIQAGLRGEADPLERFGVGLSQASIEAYSVKHGLSEAGAEMTNSQKVTARLGLLFEQTNRVAGDFANTSGGLANQQRILRARLENVAAEIGTAVMPMVLKVVNFLNDKGIPAFESFAGFISKVGKQKTWDLRIHTVLSGVGGALEKILFGSPATRVKVPIEGGRFEWQVKGGGRGLVGAIADAIRDIDWVSVGKQIAQGTKTGIRHGITAAGFDPDKGLLPQVWPHAFGWLGAEVPMGPSGWDVIHKALGGLEDDAGAATIATSRFERGTTTSFQRAQQAGETFRNAMREHLDKVKDSANKAGDGIRGLRSNIEKLHSKTIDVTVNATVNIAGVRFLPSGQVAHHLAEGMAEGGIVKAVPGGVYRVAEAGYPEAVLSTDPRHKRRTYSIISEVVKRLEGGGLLPGLADGGLVGSFSRRIQGLVSGMGGTLGQGLLPARAYSEALRMTGLHQPYLWGGGHAGFSAGGPWDCSGAVSEVLHAAGYPIRAPMVSGALAGWGRPGGSSLMEVLANATHTYMRIFGKSFGTSGENPGGGFGGPLSYGQRSGFAVRQFDRGGYLPPGLSLAYNGTGRPEPVGGGSTYNFYGPVYGEERYLEDMLRRLDEKRSKRNG